ncbi:phage protein Gp36 family protein [Serpentinimonas maccroryi]|uniref:phage protein Gp36 family protein n=1 Tax=Serpentinimonas maccroryi TaxID=1458426 RepID=UPI0020341F96|nr:phage protein Gp36 family protein [Serpentinimonas maccroryi]MCM2480201.1 DUF1320 domain-containing protein [Serpentinimonas maccroryi]
MAYANLDDLARAATGGWGELAQRASATSATDVPVAGALLQATAAGADRSPWPPEQQLAADAALLRLHDALERASRHADTYLFPRYRQALPLAPALVQGSDLPSVVAAIALKRLYGTSVPEDLRRGTQWADDYLLALSKGNASLGAADLSVAQPAGQTRVQAPAKAIDWSRY